MPFKLAVSVYLYCYSRGVALTIFLNLKGFSKTLQFKLTLYYGYHAWLSCFIMLKQIQTVQFITTCLQVRKRVILSVLSQQVPCRSSPDLRFRL